MRRGVHTLSRLVYILPVFVKLLFDGSARDQRRFAGRLRLSRAD
jgi:hypothetical protein